MMDNEVKQFLIAMEARFKERLDDKVNESEARLIQRMEKIETSLLTAFHQWASPAEMRARTHSAAIRAGH
ncbi:MAG: hypothetical protein H7Y20_18335 [Bryobacteraceae bacterium]|nr:hypothetical protein [Bryobacteraceae bacterium]